MDVHPKHTSSRAKTTSSALRRELEWELMVEEMRWSAYYYGREREMLFEKVARWPGKLIVLQGYQDERVLAKAMQAVI